VTGTRAPIDTVVDELITNQLYFLRSSVDVLRKLRAAAPADTTLGTIADIHAIIDAASAHGRALLEMREKRGVP
jgi:hypothetical protein